MERADQLFGIYRWRGNQLEAVVGKGRLDQKLEFGEIFFFGGGGGGE